MHDLFTIRIIMGNRADESGIYRLGFENASERRSHERR